MNHTDPDNEPFTEWAQSLPKPTLDEAKRCDSLAAAKAELGSGALRRTLQVVALAACWIAIGFFHFSSYSSGGDSPAPTTLKQSVPESDPESSELFAELYPERSPFQLKL